MSFSVPRSVYGHVIHFVTPATVHYISYIIDWASSPVIRPRKAPLSFGTIVYRRHRQWPCRSGCDVIKGEIANNWLTALTKYSGSIRGIHEARLRAIIHGIQKLFHTLQVLFSLLLFCFFVFFGFVLFCFMFVQPLEKQELNLVCESSLPTCYGSPRGGLIRLSWLNAPPYYRLAIITCRG